MLGQTNAATDDNVTANTVPNVGVDEGSVAFFALGRLQKQFNQYLSEKTGEIEEQKETRRFYHGSQWTLEEIRKLRERGQPPSTYNRIARKVDGIVGISEKQRQDPKAYPRNPRDDDGADVATTVVRYVTEANEWTTKKPQAFRQALTDAIAGVEFRLVSGDHGDPDIKMEPVASEDFFYDPASVHPGFTDARFMGLAKWLDVDEGVELFPDKEEEIRSSTDSGSAFSLDNDRDERWYRRTDGKIRMVEHWYVSRGQWCWAFYIGATLLVEGVSPFIDQRNKTFCRFFMFSAAIDQDGDRYSPIRNLLPIQREINQRVSILLRLALTRRLIMTRDAVEDLEEAREQWARPDGVVVVNDLERIKTDDTSQQVAEHTALLQMALDQIEAYYNINPASLAGGAHNLSGRAVNLLQAPGYAELSLLLINYRNWVIRCYRAMWNMAQHFWTAERWVRVTDDEGVAQFVQLNGITTDQYGLPSLVNALGALDVDIVLDEGPDVQNSMQDSLDVLTQFLPSFAPGVIPPTALVELMPINGQVKKKLLAQLNAPPDPAKLQAQQVALAGEQAKVDLTQAKTNETMAAAQLKHGQTLSALGSAAHKASEAHLNGAQVFSGGLQATGAGQPGVPAAPGASSGAPQPPSGPVQAQVPPGANNPLAQIGPQTPVIPGAAAGLFGGLGPPQPSPSVPMFPHPAEAVGGVLAPDGHHYVRDPRPHRAGKYLRVNVNAGV